MKGLTLILGMEFKALFISTVRTQHTCKQIQDRNISSQQDFGFLSDAQLLNTAITRAKSLLSVVGDPMSLCSIGECRLFWKDYLERCQENNGLFGCTMKDVMDYCVQSQTINPSAPSFIPTISSALDDKKGKLLISLCRKIQNHDNFRAILYIRTSCV